MTATETGMAKFSRSRRHAEQELTRRPNPRVLAERTAGHDAQGDGRDQCQGCAKGCEKPQILTSPETTRKAHCARAAETLYVAAPSSIQLSLVSRPSNARSTRKMCCSSPILTRAVYLTRLSGSKALRFPRCHIRLRVPQRHRQREQ